MTEPRFVAVHEAAHAVAHARLGFGSNGCTIVPTDLQLGAAFAIEGDPLSYAVEGEDGELEIPVQVHEKLLTVCLAGFCAQVREGDRLLRARRGATADFEKAHEVRKILGEPMGQSLARAHSFVEENWSTIQALARELLEHHTLDDVEVEYVIGIADGTGDPQALSRYRQARAAWRDAPKIVPDERSMTRCRGRRRGARGRRLVSADATGALIKVAHDDGVIELEGEGV
jgi:hypothetical protein